jgi:hypothetical protein
MMALNRPLITGRPSTEAVSIANEAKIATASKIEVNFLRLEVERLTIADRPLMKAI